MESIINYYSQFDEWGRLDREPLEFWINWHYMQQHLPPRGNILDNGAGPGKYSMALARAGYQVTLADLTPRLVTIAKEKAEEQGLAEQFSGFHVLNATHLYGINDQVFDACLMLGPLYHLQKEEERIQAVKELYRVTRSKGIVFVAFQSRMRMTVNSILAPEHWRPNNSIDSVKEFRSTGIFNHADQGRFTGAYYFEIGEIKPFMESHGFETIELIGSSSAGGLLSKEQWHYWEEKGETSKLMELLLDLSKDPSILGVSSHLLYIGRKLG